MSDYLSNLAAKTLNLVEPMRPRLPSLFEPSAQGGTYYAQAQGFGETEVEQVSQRSSDVTQNSTSQPASSMPPRTAADSPWQTTAMRSHEAATTSQAEALRQMAVQPSSNRQQNPQTLNPPPAPDGVATTTDVHTVQPTPVERTVQVNIIKAGQDDAAHHGERGRSERLASREPDEMRSVEERLLALEADAARKGGRQEIHSTPREPSNPVPVVAPRDVPAHAGSPSSSVVQPDATAEPVTQIRVTIGRVDVRAVMPTAPAPARPPSTRPPQTPSLEDYLKQRRGGRGRS